MPGKSLFTSTHLINVYTNLLNFTVRVRLSISHYFCCEIARFQKPTLLTSAWRFSYRCLNRRNSRPPPQPRPLHKHRVMQVKRVAELREGVLTSDLPCRLVSGRLATCSRKRTTQLTTRLRYNERSHRPRQIQQDLMTPSLFQPSNQSRVLARVQTSIFQGQLCRHQHLLTRTPVHCSITLTLTNIPRPPHLAAGRIYWRSIVQVVGVLCC